MPRPARLRGAALGLLLLGAAGELEAQLVPLSQDLRTPEAQEFIRKAPTARTTAEVNQFLNDAPVEFRTRSLERLKGLTQREQVQVEAALAKLPANAGPARAQLIRDIEAKRLDKQVGSGPSSSGSTSLVSSGTIPKALGFAVERGALLQSTQGTVATFRGNALGLSRALLGGEVLPDCAPTNTKCGEGANVLRGLSFSVGFDASRSKSTTAPATTTSAAPATAVLTGSKQQLENWGVRWEFINRRDVLDPVFLKTWRDGMTKDVELAKRREAFAAASEKLAGFLVTPAYADLVRALANDLREPQAATTSDCVQILENYLDKVVETARKTVPEFEATVKSVLEAQAGFVALQRDLTERALTGMSFAAEYVNSRPVNQPTQSTIRLVTAGSPMKNERVLISANAAFNWYNSVPQNVPVKKFRDFQAALQLDRRMGSFSESIDAAFALAGYYQYMADRALIKIGGDTMVAPGSGIILPGQAAVLLAPKGHIAVAQVKLTLSVKGSPMRLPIAFTWANRTELIKASEVRGHIGLTFDFDTLFAKPKTP